jgi:multiple sugar transport system substrate-binding protein
MNNHKQNTNPTFRTNLIIIIGFILICTVIYYVAGPTATKVRGKKQITYWTGWAGQELNVIQDLVDEYNESQDDVYVKTTSIAGSYQKMKISFAGGDTPDVCSTVWSQEIIDYAMRGGLEPLDDFLAASPRESDDYPDSVWEINRYDGKTYSLSINMSTFFIAYNKKIFRQVGLDPDNPPRNIEEFDRAVELCTLYKNDNPDDDLICLGFPHGTLLYWAVAFGVNFWDPVDNKVMINCPEMISCLEWMKENVDKYGYQRSLAFQSGFGNMLSPNNPFISGKIAMALVGDWYIHIIDDYAPDDFEWGWFPIPAPDYGRRNSSFLGASMFVIPSAGNNKKEAWYFLEWITDHHAVSNFKLGGSPMGAPSLRSVFEEDVYQTPYWQFVQELLESPNAMIPPKFPAYNVFLNEMNRVETYVLSGTKTPEEAVLEMSRNVQTAIDEALSIVAK